MNVTRARITQVAVMVLVHAVTLIILTLFLPGLHIERFVSAIGAALILTVTQIVFWILFIQFLSWLPTWLFPILIFGLSGFAVIFAANLVPGVTVDNWITGFWIAFWFGVVNALVGSLFTLDEGSIFDNVVTTRLAKRTGPVTHSDVPGTFFLEIDGLGEQMLRKAIDGGYMPNLKRWLDQGSHRLTPWETDFSSQTGAMQMGILMGNNDEIPAYRWWDRETKRIVMTGNPKDALVLETERSTGNGLLSNGGASRGNMFSGDAAGSMLTISTVLKRGHSQGQGIYAYLFSPYVVSRLITRFIFEILVEWKDAFLQKRRNDPFRISARNPSYALLRAFLSPFLQDLTTYIVIQDMLRGVPSVYALYAGYDDLCHFAGIHSPEALKSLRETDRYIARIESAMKKAPRPYHFIVLSDHGQTLGLTYEKAHGLTLEGLVDGLMKGKGDVYVGQNTHEMWDKLGVLASESVQDNDNRTAKFVDSLIKNKQFDDVFKFGPQVEDDEARQKEVVVVGSGCAGLIYFTKTDQRMTLEQIANEYPGLVVGLVKHPGIGFVMVKSQEHGEMVIGSKGIVYLDDGKVEGENPLIPFGPNAVRHLRREAGFSNAPDLLINAKYDPETQLACGFENQVSHHGGLGGPQNHAFVLHPTYLSPGDEPIVTAVGLHNVLRGWRDQGIQKA